MKNTPRVTMAQLELRPCDITGNTAKVLTTIKEHGITSDFIVFPELTIPGYNCGELFEKRGFIDDCLDSITTIMRATTDIDAVVIVGSPSWAVQKREKNGDLRIHNSVFVLHKGKIIGKYDKILLANAYQHEDRKYFVPGENLLVLEHAGVKFGVLICEDIWRDDHNRDLVGEMKSLHPDLEYVFCSNFSYFTYGKDAVRQNLIQSISKDHKVNIAYVNAVGIGDIVKNIMVYDGQSLAYRADGTRVNGTLGAFEERVTTLTFEPAYSAPAPVHHKYAEIWTAMVYARQAMFAVNGIKAQVHVSGGLDSNIIAVLCAKALGPENCVFITNPSVHNGNVTKGNAQTISDKLGVQLHWMPVQNIVDDVMRQMSSELRDTRYIAATSVEVADKRELMATSTAEAISRTLLGLVSCHIFGSGIIAAGNHTEIVLGWASFHDPGSIGMDQPLGDLTKEELWDLADYINWLYQDELVIKSLYDGTTKPMAELADANEDPWDYKVVSGICAEMIRHRKTPRELVEDFEDQKLNADSFKDRSYVYQRGLDKFKADVLDCYRLAKRSVYKSAQSAPILILSPRSRGFSSRETIINYYNGGI